MLGIVSLFLEGGGLLYFTGFVMSRAKAGARVMSTEAYVFEDVSLISLQVPQL